MSHETFSIMDCPLGKKVPYPTRYSTDAIFTIPRLWSREKTFGDQVDKLLTIPGWMGWDIWNNYEFSFIHRGRRELGYLQILVSSQSPYLIESKSLKLYLFSFANEDMSPSEIEKRVESDLSQFTQSAVKARFFPLTSDFGIALPRAQNEVILDDLSPCSEYEVNPRLLEVIPSRTSDKQRFRLRNFRSNCLVSAKPDWAEMIVEYGGDKSVTPESLNRYLVSYREHMGIHEQCVEQVFFDLYYALNPSFLMVAGFFTRRGSLDINPIRVFSQAKISEELPMVWSRQIRQ